MTAPPRDAADLVFAGIAHQAELVRTGEVSPRELVQVCLDRIERLDPRINAFRVVFAERALAEADQAAARVRSGDERPLLGVPVAIKDDLDMAGEVTARGSRAHGGPAREDAGVVRALRAAGAIPIGKTNVPELEQWPFTESEAFGATRNPWALDRTPGGSSGGSAAAVAAGLVGAALGSDGAGSIRIPAACCALFGLKPQRGRVPHKQGWYGMSVVGGLARRVGDSALLLDVIGTGDVARPRGTFREAAASPPGSLRIALSRKVPPPIFDKCRDEATSVVDRAAEALRGLGHEVVEREIDYAGVGMNSLARYLRGIRDDARDMAHPERLERRTKAIARFGALWKPERTGRERVERVFARMNAVFEDCDLAMTPGLAQPPLRVGQFDRTPALKVLADVASFTPWTAPWNAAGNPAMAVPIDVTAGGLPRAAHVIAPVAREDLLLSLAGQLEAELGWPERRPPLD